MNMNCTSLDSERKADTSKAVKLFSKPFEQRSPHENEYLIRSLKHMTFFSKESHREQSDAIYSKLLPVLKVQAVHGPSVVVHSGEMMNKFFVVLQGGIRRYTPMEPHEVETAKAKISHRSLMAKESETSKANGQEVRRTIVRQGCLSIVPEHGKHLELPTPKRKSEVFNTEEGETQAEEEANNDIFGVSPKELEYFEQLHMPKYWTSKTFKYKRVRDLHEGDHFGDICLNFGLTNETILLAWDTIYLLSLEKKHYEQIFEQNVESAHEKAAFFKSNLLSNFSDRLVINFASLFETVHCRTGIQLFKEEKPTEGFWIIKEGNIEIIKTLELDRKNEKLELRDEKSPLFKKKLHKALVVTLGVPQLVGEEEVLGIGRRIFTAIARASSNTLYYMDGKTWCSLDESLKQIIQYLQGKAKTSIEGKLKRLVNALNEANIVRDLSLQYPDMPVEERSPKNFISSLTNHLRAIEKGWTSDKNPHLDSRKTQFDEDLKAHPDSDYFKKLAGLKYKFEPSAGNQKKIFSKKHISDSHNNSEIQEQAANKNSSKHYYFPTSLYQYCIESDVQMIKNRETLQFKLLKELQQNSSIVKEKSSETPKNISLATYTPKSLKSEARKIGLFQVHNKKMKKKAEKLPSVGQKDHHVLRKNNSLPELRFSYLSQSPDDVQSPLDFSPSHSEAGKSPMFSSPKNRSGSEAKSPFEYYASKFSETPLEKDEVKNDIVPSSLQQKIINYNEITADTDLSGKKSNPFHSYLSSVLESSLNQEVRKSHEFSAGLKKGPSAVSKKHHLIKQKRELEEKVSSPKHFFPKNIAAIGGRKRFSKSQSALSLDLSQTEELQEINKKISNLVRVRNVSLHSNRQKLVGSGYELSEAQSPKNVLTVVTTKSQPSQATFRY